MVKFTQEEKEWLKKNYPKDEKREVTYQKYCEVFGNIRTMASMVTYCKKNKINKPLRRYEKGNIPWSKGLSKEEHKSHFTEKGYRNMTDTSKHNFPNHLNRIKYNVPKGMVLADLGNGEKMIMDRKIYKCMTYQGCLHQGELTKAMYESYVVKRKVEEATGKTLRVLHENNTKEYLDKQRDKLLAKRRIKIVATKGEETKVFNSLTQASEELNIPISLISRVLNGERTHTHGWIFTKES